MSEERKSVIEEVKINQKLIQEILMEIFKLREEINTLRKENQKDKIEVKEIIMNIPQYERITENKKYHDLKPPPNLPWVIEEKSKRIMQE